MDAALASEGLSCFVDVAGVELVVPGYVQDASHSGPSVHRLAEQPGLADRCEIAADDHGVRLGRELGHRVPVLEVQIGDDLDAHGSGHE